MGHLPGYALPRRKEMEIYIYTVQMPGMIKETVTENADGSYTIFVNEVLSPLDKIRAVAHAKKHIDRKHFEGSNVQAIEADAHKEER